MKRNWFFPALGLALLVSPSLAAQEGHFRVFAMGRARLGVTVEMQADAEKDKIGARLNSVLPESPAEKAGLKAGDIVTRFNDTRLGGVAAEDNDVSGPGQKLVELAGDLKPGDTVKVEYRRGDDTRSTTVVAEGVDRHDFTMTLPRTRMGMPKMEMEMRELPKMEMGEMERPFVFSLESSRGGLDLVDMNAGLGEYFGTAEGALVVRTPEDSTLPLRAGDVIVALDGRKVQSSEHARRILGSYDEGETVKADVVRKQRRISVTWTVPGRVEGTFWRREGAPMRMPFKVRSGQDT